MLVAYRIDLIDLSIYLFVRVLGANAFGLVNAYFLGFKSFSFTIRVVNLRLNDFQSCFLGFSVRLIYKKNSML